MKRTLIKGGKWCLYHFRAEERRVGPHSDLRGVCTGLRGDCTGLVGVCTGLVGACTGLRGDCTGLRGDCSDLAGDLDLCELTETDRQNLIHIGNLVIEKA